MRIDEQGGTDAVLGAQPQLPPRAGLVVELCFVPVHLAPADFNTESLEARLRQQANGEFLAIGWNVEVHAEAVEEVVTAPRLQVAAPGLLVMAHLRPRAIKLAGVCIRSNREFGGTRREGQESREEKRLLHGQRLLSLWPGGNPKAHRARRQAVRAYFAGPSNSAHSHPSAACTRASVVSGTLVVPASIFCTVRG